jgi:L-ascorbate metabolism protein UlaG (beta-lactamase superfamily)
MNLPYTMTPEMVADAAKAFKPRVLYPYHYHFGKTDLPKLAELMENTPEVEIRLRQMQ